MLQTIPEQHAASLTAFIALEQRRELLGAASPGGARAALPLMETCSPLSVLVDTDNVLYVLVGGPEVSTSTQRPPVPQGKQ